MSYVVDEKGLAVEAVRKLKNFLASGLAGFKAQGLDRVKALGFDVPESSRYPLVTNDEINGYLTVLNEKYGV